MNTWRAGKLRHLIEQKISTFLYQSFNLLSSLVDFFKLTSPNSILFGLCSKWWPHRGGYYATLRFPRSRCPSCLVAFKWLEFWNKRLRIGGIRTADPFSHHAVCVTSRPQRPPVSQFFTIIYFVIDSFSLESLPPWKLSNSSNKDNKEILTL